MKDKYTDYDFSEIKNDIKDVIKIIEIECDCDCEEFGNMKICGRCQAVLRLNEEVKDG